MKKQMEEIAALKHDRRNVEKLMKEQTDDDNKKAYCEKADGGDCSP